MKRMGVCGNLAIWLFNFLSSRTQIVLANGARSSVTNVTSGIAQGTVLGPILFLIMINDLSESIQESVISLFADDTRVTKVIKTKEDGKKMLNDLDKYTNGWLKITCFSTPKSLNIYASSEIVPFLSNSK